MIKKNILHIQERITSLCSRVGIDAASITIVAVGKGRTIEQIKEVIGGGIRDIGENRLQEALLKYDHLKITNFELRNIKWHMVGHLQTNKVKEAVKIFDLIHSVDSLKLAEEIDKQAGRIDKVQDVLIEVNTSGEQTKFGLKPESVIEVIKTALEFKNINIKGLMTIAPFVDNPEKARPYFKLLRELRDRINKLRVAVYDLQILSMGMTDDFEVAVEEGANIIRLGRAIFEE
jgi:hypothetical protein